MKYVFLVFTGNNKVVYKAIVVDKYINKNTDGDSYIFSLLSQQSLSQRTLRHSCNFLYLLKSDYYGTITGGADFRPTIAIVAATPMSELSAVNKFLSMEELSDGIHSFEFMGTGDPVTGLGLGGMDSSSFRLLSFKIEEKTFIPQCSTDVAYDKDYTGTESVSDWEIFEAVTQNGTATIGKKNSSTTDNRWQFSVSHTANEEQAETMAVVYATMATEPGYDYVLNFEGVDIHRNNTLQNEQRPMAGDTNFNYICLVGNSLMDMVMSQQFLSQSFLGSAVNGHTVQFTAQGSSVVIALMCQYRNVDVYGDSHATLELSGILLTGYEGSTVTRVADGAGYRFGFNGMEKDDEVKGSGNWLQFGDFGYDPRTGRRNNPDPVVYPWQSGYVTFNNSPIIIADPSGYEGGFTNQTDVDGKALPDRASSENPEPLDEVEIVAQRTSTRAQANIGTRINGALKVVGGAGEAIIATGLLFVPEPTMTTKFGAAFLYTHAADQCVTGLKQLFTGNAPPTLTTQLFQSMGMSQNTAEVVDNTIGMVSVSSATNTIINKSSSTVIKAVTGADVSNAAAKGVLRSFDDVVTTPKALWGKSADEVGSMLGEGWTKGAYGSSKTGWKFTRATDGQSIFYHPGGGRHGGSYYGFSSGTLGKTKIVGPDYIPLKGDKATIINIGN